MTSETPAPTPDQPGTGRKADRVPHARFTDEKPPKRPPLAARRFGYLVAIAVNAVLLWLIHVNPGWSAAPFLTDAAEQLVPLVTFSLVVSIVVNLVWVIRDPRWLRALGDLVTAVISVVVMARLLTVFPFPLDPDSTWHTVVQMGLWVGLIGSTIGVVANLALLVRVLAQRQPD